MFPPCYGITANFCGYSLLKSVKAHAGSSSSSGNTRHRGVLLPEAIEDDNTSAGIKAIQVSKRGPGLGEGRLAAETRIWVCASK